MKYEKYEEKYFALVNDIVAGCTRCTFSDDRECTMPDDFPFFCSQEEYVHKLSNDEYALARLKGEI